MQKRRDDLIVMMLREWGFDSRHDRAANEIDIVDAPATWTSIARHTRASPHWLGGFDVEDVRRFQAQGVKPQGRLGHRSSQTAHVS